MNSETVWYTVAVVVAPEDCVLCSMALPAINVFDSDAPFNLCRIHSLRALFTLEQNECPAKRTFEGEEEVIIRDGATAAKST